MPRDAQSPLCNHSICGWNPFGVRLKLFRFVLSDALEFQTSYIRSANTDTVAESKNSIPSPISKSVQDDIQASILDSAQTILLCAQHQKRIVDDTLTISKLESNLLLIAPERTQPVALVRKAAQMYDAELSAASILWTFSVEESYKSLNIDFVFLDTSRLLQVRFITMPSCSLLKSSGAHQPSYKRHQIHKVCRYQTHQHSPQRNTPATVC